MDTAFVPADGVRRTLSDGGMGWGINSSHRPQEASARGGGSEGGQPPERHGAGKGLCDGIPNPYR